ncbi:2,3-bisphosphoglycerate-independent phosphoglycerate mutase [Tissierella creatinophila]|uniref:2,3-bisphosphoglycerate-independent phosphoglycerate mutase n=1 Tax=Tissierella creatinophila DSM 6911 TaxID=1123403 RepID=A0A1U7M9G1_TISCR|nr:2,3-bisphosphoglycerate-independent phosphoglycerate mutase [Tissierella creatinophila]OLS03838.1 2,3-bisphosphoglycerate-independent phosphoglycerate mutase [Tissierella creatinophila DSM 6911]
MSKKPVSLIILDGWGIGKDYPGNAITLGNTPNFDRLMKENPNTTLDASGIAVGLPIGQMGNSEVGHINIGSGRVIYQELPRITNAIEDGSFFEKKEFLSAIENAKKNNSKVHLIGLVSDGGVHSHVKHLYGLLELMKRKDFSDVYVHAILDGRDVQPTDGRGQIEELEAKMKEIGVGKIATVSGRYYTMDRDKRWERTKLGYDAIVHGEGLKEASAIKAIEDSYKVGVTDEFIMPTVIENNGKPVAKIEDGDSVIFFNFRPDRARQITRAIVDTDFDGFDRGKKVNTFYVSMTQYDKTISHVMVAYTSEPPINTLSQYVSLNGLNQLKMAETEKYAHVTFFFNGGIEEPYINEDRVLIPSPKVATYDLQPEMSAKSIKENLIERIKMDKYDLIVVNFANPDMVGHTGVIPAVVKSVETVDMCLGEVLKVIEEKGGSALITADHGNSEELLDDEGKPVTAHTTNKVPLIYVGEEKIKLKEGRLSDLAPTLLELMGLESPKEMTGKSLILREE